MVKVTSDELSDIPDVGEGKVNKDAAIVWFENVLPRLKKQNRFPVVDLIQEPGDTLFVPSGNKKTPS